MRINQNIAALNAYRNLVGTNNAVNKSLERLSSGLRINRAADDAAGLAISEKMRGQIRGLTQATRNAQDGISLLQTAEGALNETHSILQRIRELAVQAANDTLTANDRLEIQKEVDQLITEINRIANTTEFNTKKLLDGTASALVSSDKLSTKIYVRDGLRTIDQFGQKAVGGGNYILDIAATPGTTQIQKTDIFKIKHGDIMTDLTVNTASGLAANGVKASNLPQGSYTINTSDSAAAAVNASASLFMVYQQSTAGGGIITAASKVAVNATGNLYNASILFEVTSVNRTAGTLTVNVTSHQYDQNGNYQKVTIEGLALEESANANTVIGSITLTTFTLEDADNITAGDKFVINIEGYRATTDDAITIQASAGTFTAAVARDIIFNTAAAGTYNLRTFYLDTSNGQAYDSTLTLTFASALADASPAATFEMSPGVGQIARLDTKLYDIDRFWDANGNFLLDQPQTITLVQGNGNRATITLFSTDTIGDVQDKLNTAVQDDLGQGEVVLSGSDQFVKYVSTATDNTPEAVEGTFVIRSAVAGKAGEINFIGDQNVINALSLTVIQASQESNFTIDITDAHTGEAVKNDIQIAGNLLVGMVHPNVDVEFDANSGIVTTFDAATKKFSLVGGVANKTQTTVHLADNTLVLQIGANPLQDVNAAIGRMDAAALKIDSVLVTDRDSANRAITLVDNAVTRVSGERAKLGALQNRLEHTIANLGVAKENLTAAESRIRDLDIAEEMMVFTKNQILAQAGTAMLAQANQQPSLVLQLLR